MEQSTRVWGKLMSIFIQSLVLFKASSLCNIPGPGSLSQWSIVKSVLLVFLNLHGMCFLPTGFGARPGIHIKPFCRAFSNWTHPERKQGSPCSLLHVGSKCKFCISFNFGRSSNFCCFNSCFLVQVAITVYFANFKGKSQLFWKIFRVGFFLSSQTLSDWTCE